MKKVRALLTKFKNKVKKDNETGARKSVLEDLFYDFNRSRVQIYKMNFFRGIFFGLGSVIGGTIVVALLAWVLSLFVNLPAIGDTIQGFQDTIQKVKETKQ